MRNVIIIWSLIATALFFNDKLNLYQMIILKEFALSISFIDNIHILFINRFIKKIEIINTLKLQD
jgi:hypothetical protein